MAYDWSSLIAPEESIEKEFSLSPLFLRLILFVSLLLAIPTALISIIAGVAIVLLGFLYWFYMKKAKQYVLTKKRIILVDAFLGTNIISIDYDEIADISVEQSVFDEIGKWGTLIITTAGTHAPGVRISFVADPKGLKQLLDTIRDSNPPEVQVQSPQVV